jgi:hypothetical protein
MKRYFFFALVVVVGVFENGCFHTHVDRIEIKMVLAPMVELQEETSSRKVRDTGGVEPTSPRHTENTESTTWTQLSEMEIANSRQSVTSSTSVKPKPKYRWIEIPDGPVMFERAKLPEITSTNLNLEQEHKSANDLFAENEEEE